MVDMSVTIGGLTLANPVMPASGTFGEGLAGVVDYNSLGAMVTKTITAELRSGNPVPRVSELSNGMLNSIGIPSKGIDHFIAEALPFYRQYGSPLVVSISAPTVEDFASVAKQLNQPGIAAIEANISCPNIEEDGRAFAMTADSTARVVEALRAATALPLWVKLTPNTGDVSAVARAAENAGADALVVANTILAMSIDIETLRPTLGNIMGGMSGQAVKPIIVRMTYQCAQAARIPIIGCGGIASADDAVEYMLAGASAVQVGTASFVKPHALTDVMVGLEAYCRRKGFDRVTDLIGAISDGQMRVDEMDVAL